MGGEARVSNERRAALGPPLRGGPWLAIHLPAAPRGHRRVAFALDGALRIPARFAIDWVRLDDAGRGARGDERRTANWLGHGEDVLAVADARVVAVRDGMRERTTLDGTRHPLEEASGNHVSLDLGDGRYVHYEHLKPGSLRVRIGDRVRRGQVIAALGYTGDSTGPHLHVHVSDAAAPLAGEGLPLELDRYELLGAYDSIEAFAAGGRWKDSPANRRMQRTRMPAPNSVVRFGGP
jgi:murein DD-endopeptidase MepM/ murein hydrolase activator NlpD